MTRRTPARLLAPLALVAVAVALAAVVTGGAPGTQDTGTPAGGERTTPASGDPGATPTATRSGGRRTYTVQPGDTPSGIAEATGVPVERLLELNPDVDAQSLQTGARLKLR